MPKPPPPSLAIIPADIALESELLYMAYERMPLNLAMTVATALLVTFFCWSLFPHHLLLIWLTTITLTMGGCHLLWLAFRRAAPQPLAQYGWRRAFLIQAIAGGSSWAVAPILMMPYCAGAELALFVGLLFSVGGVAMTTLSAQENGMRAFLMASLLPPAVLMACYGGHVERLVALLMVGGMVCLFAVGHDSNKALRALLAAQARVRAVLDTAQDAIIGIDGAGRILDWNKRAETLFGWSKAEALGQTLADILLPMQHQALVNETMANFMAGQADTLINSRIELTAQTRNGAEFPIELTLTPQAIGKACHFTAFIADISARKLNERMKHEFISTVSHELRTPLTSIRGALALLEGGVLGELPANMKGLLQVANKNSQRLIVLVNDILDMEKLMSGKMVLNIAPLDLVALVRQSIAANAGYAATFKVKFQLMDFPQDEGDCMALADSDRLMQVLANLLSNAAKFSHAGDKVDLTIARQGQFLRLEVIDHGQGIPPEFQSRIFEQFAQAKNGNTRNNGGTGLGLHISKQLLEKMQGEIGYVSHVGQGTTFWCTLPCHIPGAG